MLQKTKILNLLEETFTKDNRQFTTTEWLKVVNNVMYNIEFSDYDYKNDRGTYACALYRYGSEYFFKGSKREPRYISKISRGLWEIHGPAMSHSHTKEVEVEKEFTPTFYMLTNSYPGSPTKGTIYITYELNQAYVHVASDNKGEEEHILLTKEVEENTHLFKKITQDEYKKTLKSKFACTVTVTKEYIIPEVFTNSKEIALAYFKVNFAEDIKQKISTSLDFNVTKV